MIARVSYRGPFSAPVTRLSLRQQLHDDRGNDEQRVPDRRLSGVGLIPLDVEEVGLGGPGPGHVGAHVSRDAAARLALGETADVAAAASDHSHAGLLGRREADVARLVAEGLSNKQIGAQLFISERTVDSHVRNILNKLGFSSRTQIAAWMALSNQ